MGLKGIKKNVGLKELPHISLVFFYIKKILLNKKRIGPKVKISKNIDFFQILFKNFQAPNTKSP